MSNKNKKNIKILREKSSISEFVERPLPNEEEIEEFEEIIEEEARDEEVEESLSEIYQEDDGDEINVSRLDIKKRRGVSYYFFSLMAILFFVVGVGLAGYAYIYNKGSDATAVEFSIVGDEKIIAGEEFVYLVKYKNNSNIGIKNVKIEVVYPDNFIFLDSVPELALNENDQDKLEQNPEDANEEVALARTNNSTWDLGRLGGRSEGVIKIKGKIIGQKGKASTITAKMGYVPENFSSEFEKESMFSSVVGDIGFDFRFDYPTTIFIGETSEVGVTVAKRKDNFLKNTIFKFEKSENIEIIGIKKEKDSNLEIIEDDDAFVIDNITEDDQEFVLEYKIKEKTNDKEKIKLIFGSFEQDGEYYEFLEKEFEMDVIKSDLNLSLSINGEKNNKAVDFGEKLNYAIEYENNGDANMEDVVIMVVLDGRFFDWTTLDEKNNGSEKGNTITWSKKEIPELENIAVDERGSINFSIQLLPFRESDIGESSELKSYAQFNIGNIDDFKENEDNLSNTIIQNINSDLGLKEEVRYFNDDNIPVGSGPLPPKVNETTTFKVYWTITNNLHEVQDTKVSVKLGEGVLWGDKNRTSVGSVSYDSVENSVIWNIGRLPISVYKADAEFNIELTPEDKDAGKIMVLLPGSKIEALDAETNSKIDKSTTAKTTRLEDDDIASLNNDGRVE